MVGLWEIHALEAATSLLTSVIRINSPALLVSYDLNHGKGRRARKPFLQKEEAERPFAITKDENLFIFAQIRHLRSDFITKRTNILVNSEDYLHGGSPINLFNYSLCLALLQVLLRSPRNALHRQRPGHVHGLVRLLRPPHHALHWRGPTTSRGP